MNIEDFILPPEYKEQFLDFFKFVVVDTTIYLLQAVIGYVILLGSAYLIFS